MADYVRKPGGAPVASADLVSADQITILGSGSAENPLHAGAGGGTFQAAGESVVAHVIPKLTALTMSVNGAADLAVVTECPTDGSPCVGLAAEAIPVVAGVQGRVQTAGIITATTTEWDAVTGQSGGLTKEANYFVSQIVDGRITPNGPVVPGQFQIIVGIALNSTTLLIQIQGPTVVS